MKKIFAQLIACGSILLVGGTTGGIVYGTWDKPKNTPASEDIIQEENFKIDGGYRFEFEEAEIAGKSQNSNGALTDHMCIAHSLEFSPQFSNGFCMKNIQSVSDDVSFTFEFNSSIACTATINLSVASKYKNSSWSEINLSTSYDVLVNGSSVSLNNVKIPKATASDVADGASNYFAMVKSSFDIDLVKGDNEIVFKSQTISQNVDYFDLMTDSVISYSPVRTLGKGDDIISIVKTPTVSETGKISLSCSHVGCVNGKDGTLPILTNPFYKVGTGVDEGKYSVILFGKKYIF